MNWDSHVASCLLPIPAAVFAAYSSHRCFLSTYCGPGAILGTKDPTVRASGTVELLGQTWNQEAAI